MAEKITENHKLQAEQCKKKEIQIKIRLRRGESVKMKILGKR